MGVFGDAWNWVKDAVTPDSAPEEAKYWADKKNFEYGLGEPGSYANQQSEIYKQRQDYLTSLGAGAQNRAAPQQTAPEAYQFTASGGQNYLNGADAEARQQQLAALGAINQYAQQGAGPSAAQAQLREGLNSIQAQQYGMARSQPGGGGAAMRNAAFNAAGAAGTANSQAAQIRAQEEAAWRQQQLSALGAVQQGAGQLRAGDQGMAQAQAQQANQDAGSLNAYGAQQQQIQGQVGQNNLQAQLATNQQNDAMTLGAGQQVMGYDAMRNQLANQQTGSQMAYEQARQGQAAQAAANFKQEQDQWLGYVSAGSGLVGSAAGAMAMSDVRAKKNIERADVLESLGGDAPPSHAAYPELTAPDTAALDAAYTSQGGAPNLRPAQGYEYSYKDPQRHGEGRFVGPMAQDLEQLPGVVQETPGGGKAIDTSRLSLVNTAAVSEQQRRLDELERRQRELMLLNGGAQFGGAPYPTTQAPNFAALDGAGGYR